MKKTILIFICLLSSFSLMAESYSHVSTVKGYSVGENFVRVQLESMKSAEGCSSSKYYYLNTTNSKDLFTAIVAARSTGQFLSLQLVGCSGAYPVIKHVYVCDSLFCS